MLNRLLLTWTCLLSVLLAGIGHVADAVAQDKRAAAREPLFLIATPQLADPNFAQTVVLVAFPEDGGPIGVILNRPTPLTLGKLFPDDAALKSRTDHVSFGGPVKIQALMFLYRSQRAEEDALPMVGDLYLSNNADVLHRLLTRSGEAFIRYFAGFAGWAPGQLEAEIEVGGWYIMPADLDTVLNADPKRMWQQLLLRATAVKT